MIFIDAHCDTITKIMKEKEGLFENSCHIDIKRMKSFKGMKGLEGMAQFFATFIDTDEGNVCSLKKAIKIICKLNSEVEFNCDDVALCKNYDEVKNAIHLKKIAAIISIEGGEALEGKLSSLRIFYLLGVRSICLTWNYKNEIADGVADAENGVGLTDFGKSVVKEMNKLGMIVDLSHISEKGFWDTIEICSSPLIVSHSNAKKLCNHRRNLTNDQILAVAKNGGVVGVNLYPNFLCNEGVATIKDVINHIEYMSGLAGEKHVGLGADFDGVESLPDGISGIEDIYKIFDELARLNYSEDFIKKIAGENFLRVIKEVL